ncbi:hypothetical protein [Algoriphagus pacificus]|uniref:Uncharacterized protein n=1 Tax=Algoriphagus pacificus TaxID=2811234 RepID=A0ABS3CG98_9BACT|nr:hypothetical protein [Algoriphagus pacificus]MBN7816108.1 hypothetical protein [Algoriphagus pacificus]
MKSKSWNLLVLSVILLTVVAYLFLFSEQKIDPELGSVPYIFWTGFIVTVVVVFATFLGSKLFPYEDPKKP